MSKQETSTISSQDELFSILTKNVDDWDFDRFNAIHEPTEINYWICNGFSSFKQQENTRGLIGYINRIKLWFWLKEARRQQIIKKYNKANK